MDGIIIKDLMENTEACDSENNVLHRNKKLKLDEVIRMRYLLIDKINDFADKDKSLFSTPTETIFEDMVSFYQSGQYEKLKPNEGIKIKILKA